MMFTRRWLLTISLVAAVAAPAVAQQEQPPKPAPAASSQPASGIAPYIKVVDDAETGISRADLSVRTLKPTSGKGPTVHLVSAVHIADSSFYKSLQEFLDKQDVVLFEGVKPPGAGELDLAKMSDADKAKLTRKRLDLLTKLLRKHHETAGEFPQALADLSKSEKRFASLIAGLLNDGWGRAIAYKSEKIEQPQGEGKEPANIDSVTVTSLGADGQAGGEGAATDVSVSVRADAPKKKQPLNIQQQLADALGLTFQLEGIDSSKANWRNSDMAADEVEDRIKAAGGDADALFSMLDGSSFMSKLASVAIMFIKTSPTMATTVKYMLLETMAGADQLAADSPAGAKGPMAQMAPMMKVIIKDRNKVVLDDLRKIISSEPGIKSVAIFYGAGHMIDMEQHLVADLGYKMDSETWFPAIAVDPKAAGMKPKEAEQMRKMIRKQIEAQLKGK